VNDVHGEQELQMHRPACVRRRQEAENVGILVVTDIRLWVQDVSLLSCLIVCCVAQHKIYTIRCVVCMRKQQ
jgi:hypothetical protein